MLKKISVSLIIMILSACLLQVAVMADVLEVDTNSPEFKSDCWQNNVATNEIFPLISCFETTIITVDAGVDASEIKRFSSSVMVGAENIEGEPVIIDGRATVSIVFPFKQMSELESITLKFPVGTRQYFFLLYTSLDGQTWTAADISDGAQKTTLEYTYGVTGEKDGPGGVECWASIPQGDAPNGDRNPVTFKLPNAIETKYVKFTFYGNDAANGKSAIENQWVSFNSLSFEGTEIAVIETAQVELVEPSVVSVSANNPVTADNAGLVILTSFLVFSAVLLIRKKISKT